MYIIAFLFLKLTVPFSTFLDSFKSFLSAVSNVEGIDSVVSPTENEREPNGSRGMNVNFDNVYDILNGIRSSCLEV